MLTAKQLEVAQRFAKLPGMDREIVLSYLAGKSFRLIAQELDYHRAYVRQVCEPFKMYRTTFKPEQVEDQLRDGIADILRLK